MNRRQFVSAIVTMAAAGLAGNAAAEKAAESGDRIMTVSGRIRPEELGRARVHRASGLTIAIHTADDAAALDEIRLLRREGGPPSAHLGPCYA
ncbi:MAG: hypothetical protein JWM59_4935 [Verrucomicrobiales bacterium]|nr:hypothetical protein [Verrucomicrobiales bacterium]